MTIPQIVELTAEAAVAVQFSQKAVIIDAHQAVLLVARLDDDGSFLKWELPGGRIQADESLDAALRREVWEEVGLEIEPGPPVHLWTWKAGDAQIIAAARRAYARPGTTTAENRDSDEGLGEISWIPLTDIESMPMDPDTRAAIVAALTIDPP